MLTTTVTTLTQEAIARHLSSLSDRGKSSQTTRAYGGDLREFLRWASLPELPMAAFENEGMRWLNQYRTTLAPKTMGRRRSSLRSFAKWAGYPSLLGDYSDPTPAQPEAHPIPEGMAGVRRMIEVATDPRHKAIVAFGGMAGLRIAETLALKPSDIDLQRMSMTVHGKGDKRRIVPVMDECWTNVQRCVLDAAVYRHPRVIDYQDRAARQIVTDLGRKAGLSRPVSSHDLRATFASAVYEIDHNIKAVGNLLGHASTKTTEGYIGIRMETMRDLVGRL